MAIPQHRKLLAQTKSATPGWVRKKFFHGPIAAGDRTFCHVLEGKHNFRPITNVGKLCRDCHNPHSANYE